MFEQFNNESPPFISASFMNDLEDQLVNVENKIFDIYVDTGEKIGTPILQIVDHNGKPHVSYVKDGINRGSTIQTFEFSSSQSDGINIGTFWRETGNSQIIGTPLKGGAFYKTFDSHFVANEKQTVVIESDDKFEGELFQILASKPINPYLYFAQKTDIVSPTHTTYRYEITLGFDEDIDIQIVVWNSITCGIENENLYGLMYMTAYTQMIILGADRTETVSDMTFTVSESNNSVTLDGTYDGSSLYEDMDIDYFTFNLGTPFRIDGIEGDLIYFYSSMDKREENEPECLISPWLTSMYTFEYSADNGGTIFAVPFDPQDQVEVLPYLKMTGPISISEFEVKPRLTNLTRLFGKGNEPTDIVNDPRMIFLRKYWDSHPEGLEARG